MEMKTKNEVLALQDLKIHSQNVYDNEVGPNRGARFDKTRFGFSSKKATHNLHNVIYFCHHSGIYGGSSVSSAFRDDFSEFIIKAIDKKRDEIFNLAIELIGEEISSKIEDLKSERNQLDSLIEEIQ